MLCYGPLMSELVAQNAWCPVIGGLCPSTPPAPPPMMEQTARLTDARSVELMQCAVGVR